MVQNRWYRYHRSPTTGSAPERVGSRQSWKILFLPSAVVCADAAACAAACAACFACSMPVSASVLFAVICCLAAFRSVCTWETTFCCSPTASTASVTRSARPSSSSCVTAEATLMLAP